MPLDSPALIEALIQASGGVPVVYGAGNTYGHLDEADESVHGEEGGAVYGTERLVRVATGILPALKNQTAITVGGTAYRIRDHRRIDDGAMTAILLAG